MCWQTVGKQFGDKKLALEIHKMLVSNQENLNLSKDQDKAFDWFRVVDNPYEPFNFRLILAPLPATSNRFLTTVRLAL